MAEHSSKTCVICGKDRTGLPRVKDPKGRYYCPECFDAAIARKQARQAQHPRDDSLSIDPNDETSAETAADAPSIVPPPVVHPSLMDDLIEQAMPSNDEPAIGPCEHCGQPVPVTAILCTACGYNRQTGEALTIHTAKSKTEWATESGVFITPGVVGGGLMAVFGILFFIGRTVEPVALTFIFSFAIFALAISLATLFFAFRVGIGQGLLTLFVPLYVLWFVYGVHPGPYMKWLYGAMLVGGGFLIALLVAIGIESMPGDILADFRPR